MSDLVTNNYLLVKLLTPRNQLAESGIFLTDKQVKQSQWGWVLSVGEGLSDMNGVVHRPQFEVGDLVYFDQHAPEKVDYTPEGLEVLHMVSEGDVRVKFRKCADGDSELIPMGNYIHIEPLEDTVQKVSPGGIVLPDQVVERPTKGRVLAVGPGQRTAGGFYSPRVSVGDVVRYRQHSTFVVKFDDLGIKGGKQHLIPYGDILLIETEGYTQLLKERLANLEERNNDG